jgi:hypothetical protein
MFGTKEHLPPDFEAALSLLGPVLDQLVDAVVAAALLGRILRVLAQLLQPEIPIERLKYPIIMKRSLSPKL